MTPENFGSRGRSARIAKRASNTHSEKTVDALNALLHEYSGYIIGRMGLPYLSRCVNIISVALDAPADVISALAEKLDAIEHVRASVAHAEAE